MISPAIHRDARLLLIAIVAVALGATCTFGPSIPSARVLCDPAAPKCPSGYLCQPIVSASVAVSVCCRTAGCTDALTAGEIARIVDAAVSSGLVDAGHGVDGPGDARGSDRTGPVCGNGTLELNETCDPSSTCPSSCPAIGCELQGLQGSADTCNARCAKTANQTACVGGDSCCPPGCTAANDSDCACTCGNAIIETTCGERCDPLSTCPTSCPPVGCMLRRLANGASCQAQCVDDVMQTACVSGDGCCPAACNSINDSDCAAACGNGTLETGETCDPIATCPTSCPPVGCQRRALQGSASSCTAQCVNSTLITSCTSGDDCCPSACNTTTDNDCNCQCGNGVTEAACGEECDGANCPTSCPPIGCQLRTLRGAACTAKCVDSITQTTCANGDSCCPAGCNANNDDSCRVACGNGVVEAGEACDPPSDCQTQYDACVSDTNTIRTRTGGITICTFACMTTPRPCSDTSDGICPSACTPCAAACGAGQDIDCKKSNGTACLANGECLNNLCVDGYCCNAACGGSCDRCDQAGSLGTCVNAALGTVPASPGCTNFYACNGSSPSCPPFSCSTRENCLPGYNCRAYNTVIQCIACNPTGVACTSANAPVCCSSVCAAGACT